MRQAWKQRKRLKIALSIRRDEFRHSNKREGSQLGRGLCDRSCRVRRVAGSLRAASSHPANESQSCDSKGAPSLGQRARLGRGDLEAPVETSEDGEVSYAQREP